MDEGKDYSALEKKLQEYKGLIEGLRAENKFIKTELIKINRTIRLIIDKLPQPIVVVSKDGKISFTNNSFIELLPYEARELSEKVPGLTDIDIRQVFPPEIHMLFLNSLHGGNDIVNAEIEIKEALMNLSIYCLKKGEQVLAIFRNLYDNNVLKKEEIASRIRDVIDKNLAMIQKIGFLMGEETSETTKILNSIIKSIGEK